MNFATVWSPMRAVAVLLVVVLSGASASGDVFALSDAYISGRDARTPRDVEGIQFSGVFGDYAVLQRDRRVAVYGMVSGDSAVAEKSVVTVTVASGDGDEEVYTTTVGTLGGDVKAWRVELEAHSKGGDYAVTASVAGSSAVLKHVTFGDVFFCSGQSNAWLAASDATEELRETVARRRARGTRQCRWR